MFRTLDQADLRGKRVLVRVDLNVPIENGKVADATRIERVAPTITRDRRQGRQGDPAVPFRPPERAAIRRNRSKPVAAAIAKVLDRPVAFADDCVGETAEAAVARDEAGRHSVPGEHPLPRREEKNDPAFVAAARGARRHLCQRRASRPRTAPMPRPRGSATCCRPMPAAPCRKSSTRSRRRWRRRQRPLAAIVGGAKVSTKLDLLGNLLDQGRHAHHRRRHGQHLPGRAGQAVGKSLREHDLAETARDILDKAKADRPRDRAAGRCRGGREIRGASAVARGRRRRGRRRRHDPRHRPAQRSSTSCSVLARAKTLVWNGPFGAFETRAVRQRHRRGRRGRRAN